jgi:hypothetical protein
VLTLTPQVAFCITSPTIGTARTSSQAPAGQIPSSDPTRLTFQGMDSSFIWLPQRKLTPATEAMPTSSRLSSRSSTEPSNRWTTPRSHRSSARSRRRLQTKLPTLARAVSSRSDRDNQAEQASVTQDSNPSRASLIEDLGGVRRRQERLR